VVDCFTPNLKRHENNTSCRCLVLLVASSQKHQLVFLPQYDDSPARLGMLLDRRINPKIAEEHAVRPYMAAQSRISEFAKSYDLKSRSHAAALETSLSQAI